MFCSPSGFVFEGRRGEFGRLLCEVGWGGWMAVHARSRCYAAVDQPQSPSSSLFWTKTPLQVSMDSLFCRRGEV